MKIGGASGNVVLVRNEDLKDNLVALKAEAEITSLAFSSKGDFLACGANDTNPMLYSVLKDESITVRPGHESSVKNVFFDPTDSLLCSTGCEGVLHIYSVDLILAKSSNSLLKAYKICRDTKLFEPQQLRSAWYSSLLSFVLFN